MRDLGVIEGGCLAARDGRIVFAGTRADFEKEVSLSDEAVILEGTDRTVLPGFVDAHTHLAFAGSRHEEFALRLKVGTHVLIPQAHHEILQETDELRQRFWATFDAYLGVDATAA